MAWLEPGAVSWQIKDWGLQATQKHSDKLSSEAYANRVFCDVCVVARQTDPRQGAKVDPV